MSINKTIFKANNSNCLVPILEECWTVFLILISLSELLKNLIHQVNGSSTPYQYCREILNIE